MNITIDPSGVWYHGSNLRLNMLREGSTVTQWRALAEAFSHKPAVLGYEDDGSIIHTGREYGYLYEIAEPVAVGTDIYQHPNTSMDENAEFLTGRELKLKLIAEIPPDPANEEELDRFIKKHGGA